MNLKKSLLYILWLLVGSTAYGQLFSYDYQQEITGVGAQQWHKVVLPEAVFGKLKSDYDDLRIYGVSAVDTIEIPYIVDRNNYILTNKRTGFVDSTSVRKEVDFERNEDTLKRTILRIQLPEAMRLAKISVAVEANYDYYRYMKVLADYYQLLGTGVLSSRTSNALYFNPEIVKTLQIEIANADNQPLPIKGVAVYALPYTLTARFAGERYRYYLAFGKANDYAPTYDITYFTKDIPKQLTNVSFGTLTSTQKTKPDSNKKSTPNDDQKEANTLLWWMMGIVVLLLFFFGARMVKK